MRSGLVWLVLLGCNGRDEGLIDDTAPPADEPLALEITTPTNGSFVIGDSVTVSGTATGTGASFTLAGDAMTPTDGHFTVDATRASVAWADSPLWPILGEATSSTGWLRDRVTLVQGPSVSAAEPVADGLALRLTDKLLTDATPVLASQIVGFDFASMLVTGAPVANVAGTDVFVDRFVLADAAVDGLDFQATGLVWSAHMSGVEADLRLEVPFIGTQAGTIAVDQVDIHGTVVVSVDTDGNLIATPQGTVVDITGLVITGFDSSPLIDGIINGLLTTTLRQQIEDALVQAVQGSLGMQDAVRFLDLGGVFIASDFTSVVHDADGLTAYASSTVSTVTGPVTGERLSNPHPKPVPVGMQSPSDATYGGAIYLDDDLVSALGVGLLQGGMLEQEVGGDLGGINLDTTVLGAMFEPFDQLPQGLPVTIRTHGTVAPPATPGLLDGEAGRLHVGGVELDFLVDADSSGTATSQLKAVLDVVLAVEGGESLLNFSVVDKQATVLSTPLLLDDPSGVEASVGGLVGVLLPNALSSAMGTTALPGMAILDSSPAGPDGDHLGLYFALDVAALFPDPAAP